MAYKGSGQYNAELMGGQVSAGISGIADAADFHHSGKLRIVAVSARSARARFPMCRHSGSSACRWTCRSGTACSHPAGTPQPIVELLGRELVAIVGVPELAERFVSLGLEPAPAGPSAAAAELGADFARWRPIVQQAGFKLD